MNKALLHSRSASGRGDCPQPTLYDRLVEATLGDFIDPMAPVQRKHGSGDSTLRECVLRHMARLLNASRLLDADAAAAYPQVARSVVNYGVPPLAGAVISEIDVGQVEEAIRQALMHYEPRLLPESIEVRYAGGDARAGHRNVLRFEIAAKLWHVPRPVPMLVYTDLDLESGAASVRALAER
ncbi:MAG: type VI secretion system baseplate subunit TssE [Burkholderiales bacterium]|nr:type VI secretion system baseplate subunit TssE [Burkholderiales bacterium]